MPYLFTDGAAFQSPTTKSISIDYELFEQEKGIRDWCLSFQDCHRIRFGQFLGQEIILRLLHDSIYG
jgi:hypothetical protein